MKWTLTVGITIHKKVLILQTRSFEWRELHCCCFSYFFSIFNVLKENNFNSLNVQKRFHFECWRWGLNKEEPLGLLLFRILFNMPGIWFQLSSDRRRFIALHLISSHFQLLNWEPTYTQHLHFSDEIIS